MKLKNTDASPKKASFVQIGSPSLSEGDICDSDKHILNYIQNYVCVIFMKSTTACGHVFYYEEVVLWKEGIHWDLHKLLLMVIEDLQHLRFCWTGFYLCKVHLYARELSDLLHNVRLTTIFAMPAILAFRLCLAWYFCIHLQELPPSVVVLQRLVFSSSDRVCLQTSCAPHQFVKWAIWGLAIADWGQVGEVGPDFVVLLGSEKKSYFSFSITFAIRNPIETLFRTYRFWNRKWKRRTTFLFVIFVPIVSSTCESIPCVVM